MSDNKYTIREYQGEDREGFLNLYEHTFGQQKSDEWFEWKYVDNPYVDHVSMYITEHKGDIIGARPFFALPITRRDWDGTALQPGDTMVHVEHRRQGLFTRMNKEALEKYSNSEFDLIFNFPNKQSGPGNIKMGWKPIGNIKEYYRLQDPTPLLDTRLDLPFPATFANIGGLVTRTPAYVRRILSQSPRSVNIKRLDVEVPGDELTGLYKRMKPDGLHATRSPEFFRWRFSNPDWNYKTYLGFDEAELTAALVVGTKTRKDCLRVTQVIDVLPLVGTPERNSILYNLLHKVIKDNSDTNLFVAPSRVIPEQLLELHAFWSDQSFLLSKVSDETQLMVNVLSEDSPLNQVVHDIDSWTLTFAEFDTK